MSRRAEHLGAVVPAVVPVIVPAVVAAVTVDQLRRSRARSHRRSRAEPVRAAAVSEASDTGWPAEPLVVVVMAALNEAESIGGVLAAVPDRVCGLAVRTVVVDDGSSDDTAVRARAGAAVVARHRRNLGQGDALRTGFAVALGAGARVVVTMDADGQHDPDELATLVAPVLADQADYVQGSRFLGRYDDAGGARQIGIMGFTVLINFLGGTSITDATNGFRAIRSSSLARLQLVEDRFSAAELLLEASAANLRMLEVPVHIRGREVGTSRKPRGLGYPLGYLGVILRTWLRARGVGGSRAEVPRSTR